MITQLHQQGGHPGLSQLLPGRGGRGLYQLGLGIHLLQAGGKHLCRPLCRRAVGVVKDLHALKLGLHLLRRGMGAQAQAAVVLGLAAQHTVHRERRQLLFYSGGNPVHPIGLVAPIGIAVGAGGGLEIDFRHSRHD